MLTDGDLLYMRDALEELLPDTCNILTAAVAIDGQGAQIPVWGTATANVPCRLDPSRKDNREYVTGGALQPFSYWQLTLPHNTSLSAEQRIEHGGQVYAVIGVDDGKSWTGTVRAMVVRV